MQQPPSSVVQQKSADFPSPFRIPITTLNKRVLRKFMIEIIFLLLIALITSIAFPLVLIAVGIWIALIIMTLYRWQIIYVILGISCLIFGAAVGFGMAGIAVETEITSTLDLKIAIVASVFWFFVFLMLHAVSINKNRKQYHAYEDIKKYAKEKDLSLDEVINEFQSQTTTNTENPFANMQENVFPSAPPQAYMHMQNANHMAMTNQVNYPMANLDQQNHFTQPSPYPQHPEAQYNHYPQFNHAPYLTNAQMQHNPYQPFEPANYLQTPQSAKRFCTWCFFIFLAEFIFWAYCLYEEGEPIWAVVTLVSSLVVLINAQMIYGAAGIFSVWYGVVGYQYSIINNYRVDLETMFMSFLSNEVYISQAQKEQAFLDGLIWFGASAFIHAVIIGLILQLSKER